MGIYCGKSCGKILDITFVELEKKTKKSFSFVWRNFLFSKKKRTQWTPRESNTSTRKSWSPRKILDFSEPGDCPPQSKGEIHGPIGNRTLQLERVGVPEKS